MLLVAIGTGLPAEASFAAAELIYVPFVAHNEGTNDSVWRSDLTITNVSSDDAIDVAMVFVPSGLTNNSYLFSDRTLWVGGREEDSFGILDEQLADIPPLGTVTIGDVVEAYWPDNTGVNGIGVLVMFSYLADTLEDDGTRDDRDMIVSSRTYNVTTIWEPDPDNEGEFLELDVTFGQGVQGVPWYNLADPAYVDEENSVDLSYQIIQNAAENEDFRFNLGLFNGSDRQTELTMALTPYYADGQPFVNDDGEPLVFTITVPPLAHIQYNQILGTVFSETDITDVRFEVRVLRWSTSGSNPKPLFTSYGSVVDNGSNDPTTVLPMFATPYNVECMWPPPEDDPEKGLRSARAAERRPLDLPATKPVR
jgi:hypothetical protein